MELRDAIELVWSDVADCVLRDATARDAIDYARSDDVDLSIILDDQRAGRFDDSSQLVFGDVYGSYVDVRDASSDDVYAIADELDARNA